MEDRQLRIIAILLAVIGLLLLALLLWLLFSDDDGGAAATTTSTSAGADTTTSQPVTTSADATTTTGEVTTTSGAGSTTTTTVPATTTTTATTTTIPEIVLGADGIGDVDFGSAPDDAIDYVTGVLGPSTEDSGWIDAVSSPYGVCPAPQVRGVHWGAFVLLFTTAATDFATAGTEHLFSYYYTDSVAPANGLGTAENVFIGSTRSELDAAYGARLEVFDDVFGVGWQVDRDPSSQTALSGYLSGATSTDLVEAINGGVGCGE